MVIVEIKCDDLSLGSIPKGCEYKHIKSIVSSFKLMSCSIKRNFRIEFNAFEVQNLKIERLKFWIKPAIFESNTKVSRKTIDMNSLLQYINSIQIEESLLQFTSIKAFDLDLFNLSDSIKTSFTYFLNCDFNFYIDERKLSSCQDFYTNITTNSYIEPKSIFQSKSNYTFIVLSETKDTDRICPLVFKNFFSDKYLSIAGVNSFYSRRILRFSNDTFVDLNSSIYLVIIDINNIELNLELLNPSVFEKIEEINLKSRVKSIDPEIFVPFKELFIIYLQSEYVKALMHNERGIEWIKHINMGLNISITNLTEMNDHWNTTAKFLYLDCNEPTVTSHMSDVFPDEDFCLYKDFPFNQLVILVQKCTIYKVNEYSFKYYWSNLSCTYLWLIQYYGEYENNYSDDYILKIWFSILTSTEEFQSMSRCDFERRLEMCNRSNYRIKPVITYFEIEQRIIMVETVLNIASYPLAIFGIVTNLFIIITISSKKNKEDFKELKQYSYLRINSICSCLILSIHFFFWITDCFYPYQVFCSEARKTLFLQYFKIIIVEVFGTSLRFMNNFTYIAFALNRISLIGKDHNKLVKFMSDVGIKKYIALSLFLSIGFSAVKFFSYRINYAEPLLDYPIQYDFLTIKLKNINPIYFSFNFASDLLNYVVFLLLHLLIDIGMIVKLRQTLNEKLEKAKAYCTKDQQEKKKKENEKVINKVILMIILNSTIGVLLKLPTLIYSIMDLYYGIYRLNDLQVFYRPAFGRFYLRFCIDANFCQMFLHLADLLFLVSISIQLFFFNHFDKKFKIAFSRIL